MKTERPRLFIKKLEIENCGRFYGKGHSIVFSDSPEENITIVIGDSGRGKSTIQDLIYWGLYGEHKDRDNRTNEDSDYGLINNDALDNLKVNSDTAGSITISIHDDSGERYRLKRTLIATSIEDTDKTRFEERNNSRVSSGLEFSEDVSMVIKEGAKQRIERNPKLIKSELNNNFPQELSDFFLFDGENLFKFKHRASTLEFIKKGITKISGLEMVTAVSEHAKQTKNIIQKDIGGRTARARPFQIRQEKLDGEEVDLRDCLNTIETEIQRKSTMIEETIRRIQQNKYGQNIIAEQKTADRNKKDVKKQLKQNNANFKEFLFENIPLLLARKSLLQAADIFLQMEADDKIPPSIPRSAIDKILNSDPLTCVCGRKFEKSEEPNQPWAILNTIKGTIIADDVSSGLSIGRILIDRMIADSEPKKLETKFNEFVLTRRDMTHKINEHSATYDSLAKQLAAKTHDDVDDLGERKNRLNLERDALTENKALKKAELERKILESKENREKLQGAIQKEGRYKSEQQKMQISHAVSKISTELAKNVEEILRIRTENATNTYFLQSAPEAASFDRVTISPNYEIRVMDNLMKVAKLSKGQAHVLGLSYVAGIRDITNTRTFLIIDSPLHNISGLSRNEISNVFSKYLPGVQIILLVTDTEYLHGDPKGAEPVRNLLKRNGNVWREYVIDTIMVGNIYSRKIKEYKENV